VTSVSRSFLLTPNFVELRNVEVQLLRICLPRPSEIRSELHTSRDRKRNVRIFEPSRGFDTPLTIALNNPQFLCRSHPRFPQLLKTPLNVFGVEGQTLDDPRGLTEESTAQTGFYTHRGLDEQASSIRPGVFTPDTPPLVASSRTWKDPRGRHGKMRERFSERLKSTYSSPGSGARRLSTLLS
jgi:hypothetical protein